MACVHDHLRGLAVSAQLLAPPDASFAQPVTYNNIQRRCPVVSDRLLDEKCYSTTRARASQRPSPNSVSSLLCRVSRLLRWPTLTIVQSGIRSRTSP